MSRLKGIRQDDDTSADHKRIPTVAADGYEQRAVSIRVMTQVWDRSSQKGSPLLLMLAIADNANDAGEAWPSVATLAKKVRMSERAVHYLIERVKASGELQVDEGGGRHHTNLYKITLKGEVEITENIAPIRRNGAIPGRKGAKTDTERVQNPAVKGATATAPEPYEPSVEPELTGGDATRPATRGRRDLQKDQGETNAATRVRPPVDEAYVHALVKEFGPRLGDARARLAVQKAMNCQSYVRARDQREYVRIWLQEDAEKIGERHTTKRPAAVSSEIALAAARAKPQRPKVDQADLHELSRGEVA